MSTSGDTAPEQADPRAAEVTEAARRAVEAYATGRPSASVVIVLVAEWPAEGGPLALAGSSYGRCDASRTVATAIMQGASAALVKVLRDTFGARAPDDAVLN